MAYVTVPKDLTKVKSKVVFGLTKRQLICFGGALLIGVPLFFLIRGRVPTSAAALIMVFAMLPGFLLALYEKHGQPLEVVVRQIVECCFIQPKELLSLVCCKLLCAVAAPHVYEAVTATFTCAGNTFTAKGKTILTPGWKELDRRFKASFKTDSDDTAPEPARELPEITEGQTFEIQYPPFHRNSHRKKRTAFHRSCPGSRCSPAPFSALT